MVATNYKIETIMENSVKITQEEATAAFSALPLEYKNRNFLPCFSIRKAEFSIFL